jgi:hypothetical protein
MAVGSLAPYVFPQFLDGNGNPYAASKLFTYAAGTTTKQDTFSDVGLTVANPNPIILDSAGRPSNGGTRIALYLTPGLSYKFVLAPPTDSDPPISPVLTQDNVAAISPSTVNTDIQGVAGEALATGELVYLSDGTGGLTIGRWYKTDADFGYRSSAATMIAITTEAISAGATGTLRKDGRLTGLSSLTAGSAYYVSAAAGALTPTAPTNRRFVGVADTTTSLVLAPNPLKDRVLAVVSKTGAYTVTTDDDVVNCTANSFTLTLYTAVANAGRQIRVKNSGTGLITLDGNGAETVDGVVTMPVFPGEDLTLTSDGSNWHVNVPAARRIAALTGSSTFTNTAAENSHHAPSVPANTLRTAQMLVYTAFVAVVTDAGGARNVNVRVKFGGVTILSGNVPFPASQTHFAELRVVVFASGATNAQRAVGVIIPGSTAGGTTWSVVTTAIWTLVAGNTAMAVDTTAAQTFEITTQMDSAQAAFSVTLYNAVLMVQ